MRPGAVAADLDEHLAIAAEDGGGHAVAIRAAGRNRGFRDRQSDLCGQVLVVDELRARGRRQCAGKADPGQPIQRYRHGRTLPLCFITETALVLGGGPRAEPSSFWPVCTAFHAGCPRFPVRAPDVVSAAARLAARRPLTRNI